MSREHYYIKGGVEVTHRKKTRKSREKELDKLVAQSLKHAFGMQCYAFHAHQAVAFNRDTPWMVQNKGQPDWTGHVYGIFFHIECKVRPNTLGKDQKLWMTQVNNTGGIACMVVLDPTDESYWFVSPGAEREYSYASRIGWVRMNIIRPSGVLDLTPFFQVIRARAALVYSLTQGASK